jgi:hypothetical protein
MGLVSARIGPYPKSSDTLKIAKSKPNHRAF